MQGVDGKPLKIVQKIAAHDYTTFGMYLLQDENGEEVTLIEKDHIIKGAESVTQAILQKWLTSDAPTRTYQHLIECLRQSELGALAELIANTTGQGMPIYSTKQSAYTLILNSWFVCVDYSICVMTIRAPTCVGALMVKSWAHTQRTPVQIPGQEENFCPSK